MTLELQRMKEEQFKCQVSASRHRFQISRNLNSAEQPHGHENKSVAIMLKNLGTVKAITRATLKDWKIWERSLLTLIDCARKQFQLRNDVQFLYWIWSNASIGVQELAPQCRPELHANLTVGEYLKMFQGVPPASRT